MADKLASMGGTPETREVSAEAVAEATRAATTAPTELGPGLSACHRVHADRDGEDERGILFRRDLDAVGVADPEPVLGYGRGCVAVPLDLVLVVDHVSVCTQVWRVIDMDLVAVADPGDGLADSRAVVTHVDLHLVAHAQPALLDLRDLVARRVLEHDVSRTRKALPSTL